MNKTTLKISIFLAVICFVTGLVMLPYQLDSLQNLLPPEEYKKTINELPFPLYVLFIITSVQLAVMGFILTFLGVTLAKKTNLKLGILTSLFDKNEKREKIEKKPLFLSIALGVFTAFILAASDKFYFSHYIEKIKESEPTFNFLGMVTGVLYGGIIEEVMMRLFLMSLLVWIFMKLFKNKLHWIAIILSSLVFAAGHLPATEALFGEINTILLARCILLNGIGGIFFGYLYWKKGFEYGVFAHMSTHIALQLLFIPLLY